jgi:catechol 2,3-dioxygenase-like lactoylglutathione lyase family enzyme
VIEAIPTLLPIRVLASVSMSAGGMFDHVDIRVSDRESSEAFYATVLGTLGVTPSRSDEQLAEWDNGFALVPAAGSDAITRRLHIGFAAQSRAEVDEFWQAGTHAGYRDDGAPGERPQYWPDYYGGFLLDPDGNSAEAVHYAAARPRGEIDHIWIRVADVGAAQRFYETVAPYGGFRRVDRPDRAQFRGSSGSFSLVPGRPTVNLHMAFAAADDATVDAFYEAATAAGYRDNGEPGERPQYHSGYYGAFVLDPDGNNIEVVNHNRA